MFDNDARGAGLRSRGGKNATHSGKDGADARQQGVGGHGNKTGQQSVLHHVLTLDLVDNQANPGPRICSTLRTRLSGGRGRVP